MLPRILDFLANQAIEAFDLGGSIDHPGENGRAREAAIRSFLADILPPDFGIDTGFVIDALGGKRVTVRTLDLGADKYPSYMRLAKEENPFLGWRSIRISLALPDLFKVQLRAILRGHLQAVDIHHRNHLDLGIRQPQQVEILDVGLGLADQFGPDRRVKAAGQPPGRPGHQVVEAARGDGDLMLEITQRERAPRVLQPEMARLELPAVVVGQDR